MSDETFSFRWGISLLDEGDTRIPNFFFDHYAEAGVTRMEFLTILHLARYQFEKSGSECRPSVGTVARQMKYSERSVQRVLAGMEKRGLLARRYRPGETTIYNFSGFSRAVLAVELSTGGDVLVTPTPDTSVTPGVTRTSPKEEQQEEQTRNDGDGSSLEQDQSLTLLTTFGVSPPVARKLARRCDPSQIEGWLAHAERADGLRDKPAFVVRQLLDGEPVPKVHAGGDGRRSSVRGRRRYTGWAGAVAKTCPVCSLVRPVEYICPDCGRCYDCCECEEAE